MTDDISQINGREINKRKDGREDGNGHTDMGI